jgi:hypothetical protein
LKHVVLANLPKIRFLIPISSMALMVRVIPTQHFSI